MISKKGMTIAKKCVNVIRRLVIVTTKIGDCYGEKVALLEKDFLLVFLIPE
jgi:hypothetical protein